MLSEDGFIAIQIDDVESSYLKVICDEIFGRTNYLTTFYIQVRYGNKTLAEDNDYQKVIEQVHIYTKDRRKSKANRDSEEYKVEKFEWKIVEKSKGKLIEINGKKVEIFKDGEYEILKVMPSYYGLKETWATGSLVRQTGSSGEFLNSYLAPRVKEDGLSTLYKVYGMGEDGLGYRYMTGPKKETATKGKFYSGIPLNTLSELKAGNSKKFKPIQNFYDLAGSFGNCRQEGGVSFGGGKKPEVLLQTILGYFSNPGDLVLDSFLGSGTTAAVAHKMGRRWIGLELGEHAITHCVPRLKKVIDGEDSGGITKAVDWEGGGGYTFYRLAPSLLNLDGHGNYIISKEYNPDMLAAAMAKHEGFRYNPDPAIYWKQGSTTGFDFIFTTTQLVTVQMIESIQEEMKPVESLLICCKTFQKECKGKFSNITIKKIPQVLIGKCEFGKEDYSLNIIESPRLESDQDDQDITELSVQEIPKKTKKAKEQRSLFDL